ncbi:hypothetical protein J0895_04570 [Phormidium pseudopriestleyi FRX01]|uniref:Uncharacterized protein n=1 Tax=Phormidium pseudopriestleyi FRX01 TaxID=1759528 RepID=A0ABS3FMR0_9CYAN|nr:hypothetical protein [Phormidium pseudopriestleyi]MBO0348390.1 hypothetical protein [Phormidium pseudopriestleyi FRX01]
MISITLKLSPEVEAKCRKSIASGDAIALQQLLAEAFAPTVEELLQHSQNPIEQKDEFEAIANQLADELTDSLGPDIPTLSDDAISRPGIYEEHP